MSWSRHFKSLDDFMQDKGEPPIPPDADTGQIGVARQAAERIIGSGAVGKNSSLARIQDPEWTDNIPGTEKDFTISLSGHSNPDHEPRAGWANDTITVTVTQKP